MSNKLTYKEEEFAKLIAKGVTSKDAALKIYNCSSKDSAKSLGCKTKKRITKVYQDLGKTPLQGSSDIATKLNKDWVLKKLEALSEDRNKSVAVRSVELVGKFNSMFRDVNVNENIDTIPDNTDDIDNEFRELIANKYSDDKQNNDGDMGAGESD